MTVLGLTFGIAAAALLVAAALYGLRRRAARTVSRLGLGSARAWLRFHVWGGLLFLLLVLLHSGFGLPNGVVTWWLWGLSIWTVLSGLLGLGLQRWIPRVLSSLSTEVHYDRIPELVADLRQRAAALAETGHPAIEKLYREKLAAEFEGPRRDPVYFIDATGGARSRLEELLNLRRFLAAEDRETLTRLKGLYRTKLDVDAHYTLQSALRLWLFLHVPLSLMLLALLVLHVGAVVYY